MKDINIQKQTLIDEFEVDGLWHLSTNPDHKVTGKLFFSKENIELNTFGSLTDLDEYTDWVPSHTILGETLSGEHVTLFLATETRSTSRAYGFDSQTFECQFFIVGNHFQSQNDLIFDAVSFNSTYLESFLGSAPFKRTRNKPSEGQSETTMTFTPPEKLEWRIPIINANLYTSFSFSSNLSPYKNVSMQHRSQLKLVPDTSQHFEWFIEQLNKLLNLFSIFIGKEQFFKEVSLINYQIKGLDPLDTCKVFFTQKDFAEGHSVNNIQNITLSETKDQLDIYINNWFVLSNEFDSIYKLYFDTTFHGIYDEWKFLNYTRILEGYHRIRFTKSTYCDYNEYEKIKCLIQEFIEETIKEEHHKQLKTNIKNAISYSYEYSFQKRLTELGKQLNKSIFKQIFKNRDDMDKFFYKTKETRNKMTHPQTEGTKIFRGYDLKMANARLIALINAIILVDIGLSADFIAAKLPHLQIYLNLAKKHFNQ
ncbi:TPA: HEPN domain-containing protein [Bacillus thuringiensis]|uniref:ApeA N-terminal domain 1-containing protein n=1 Tax=Bacillus cereus group TaxID=86661 RepID=UPI000B4B7DD1|nr:HEPN domain-containing protein [Bacillus cereus]HDX9636364.1 hypothetical protein [Bacillus cereus]